MERWACCFLFPNHVLPVPEDPVSSVAVTLQRNQLNEVSWKLGLPMEQLFVTLPEVFLGPSGVCDVLALALRLAQGSKQILHPSYEKLAAIKGPLVNCCAWLPSVIFRGSVFYS